MLLGKPDELYAAFTSPREGNTGKYVLYHGLDFVLCFVLKLEFFNGSEGFVRANSLCCIESGQEYLVENDNSAEVFSPEAF